MTFNAVPSDPPSLRWAALSFDLDGTLVDTLDEIATAANAAIAEYGLQAQSRDEILPLVGAGSRELMRRLLQRQSPMTAVVPLDLAYARFTQHYRAIAGSSARPYPGCAVMLQRLRDAGVHLACVTNKDLHEARLTLQATRLDGWFELLIGGDSLPQRKPQREVLEHVLQTFGCERRAYAHVGDSTTDVAAARNAGVAAWAVPWGYNAGVPIATAAPDRVFDTLPAIAEHVLAENAAAQG